MLAILAALAAQTAGVITASPPPQAVVVALQPASQSGIQFGQPGRPAGPQEAVVPYPVDVIVTAEGQTLYKGTLRLARAFSASYNETVQEAPAEICPGARNFESAQRTNLGIGLNSQFVDNEERISVTLSWVRPRVAGASCRFSGSRTVQINDTVTLKPGDTVVIKGDAGLELTLNRR
jgi:hypothetical protein